MTFTPGLEITRFDVDLSSAGQQLVSQQVGYFQVWRFRNSVDGSISLDGEIGATFGGQWNAERLPFNFGNKIALATPVDRVLLEWSAQASRIAEILITRDPRGLDAEIRPVRQLVSALQGGTLTPSSITVGTTAALLSGSNPFRLRAVIQALETNLGPVFIGASTSAGTLRANGIKLDPGASFTVTNYSGSLRAAAFIAGQSVRFWEEASG
jgi:hypothetical protein